MKYILSLAVVLFFTSMNFAQSIDNESSKVEFEVSNMGKNVKGSMLNVNGTVNFNENDLEASNFEATVDPNTVSTKSKARDKHLRKDDFFGVVTYPTVSVSSQKITKTETGYEALATLTIKDVSKSITIPFTVTEENGQQHLKGSFALKRKKYGLGENMGSGTIGLDITVHIDCFVNK